MRRSLLAAPLLALALIGSTVATPATAADPAPTTLLPLLVADGPLPVAGKPSGYVVSLRTTTGDAPVFGADVDMWARQSGQTAYTKVATGHTDANGWTAMSATLTRNASVYWSFAGNASYAPSHTDTTTIPVSTSGTIRVNDHTLRIGQRLVVRGKTYPGKPGRKVRLYKGNVWVLFSPNRPKLLAKAYVRADGTYRIRVRFFHAGRKKLFVALPGGDGNVPGTTRYRRVRVG
jgi:hypothetical protein